MGNDTISKHIKTDVEQRRGHKVVGIILSIIGFFWFAKKVGWIPVAAGGLEIFWPLVVTVIGISIIFGSRYRRNRHNEERQ